MKTDLQQLTTVALQTRYYRTVRSDVVEARRCLIEIERRAGEGDKLCEALSKTAIIRP